MSSSNSQRGVVPAQLAYLTIYNPAFGDTDETAYEQIFYYYSREESQRQETQRASGGQNDTGAKPPSEEEDKNERLRQVGLARGMVEFAK